jgi:aminoglycoside phosphotransferase (APT) family kinase protein
LKLADVLSGRAKLEAIQWVLRFAAPRRTLRDQLTTLLSAPATLGSCRLRRAKLKPSHTLTAYYDAQVHVEGTVGYRPRAITVTWRLDGDGDAHHEAADLSGIQAEALRQGVAAPFRQLTADVPEWSMHLQISPLDARFPQLVRVSDPRHVHDMLAGAYAASGGAPDRARPGRYAVTAIRYHPGQRHVLRYDPLDVARGETVLAKLYTGEDGARAFRVAGRAADWLAEHGEGVTAVRPLAYVAEDAVVLYPRVVGAPLSERLHRSGKGVAECLERAGAALHALHHLPPAVAGPLKLHDFAAEVSEIAREASDHIPALLPAVGPAIEGLLARAGDLHERLSPEPPTFTHGDFKSEHIWAAPGGFTLIDFDGCRLADPAYDVGKFLADLQLWFTAYDQEGLEQVQEQFLAGYAPAPPERLLRARLYEAVQLVKIARRVPLFDRDWASLTKQVIRRAQAVMNDLELTLGVPATPPFIGFLDGSHNRHRTRGERRRQPCRKGAWG